MGKGRKFLPVLILVALLILGAVFYFFQNSNKESREIQLETQYLNPFNKDSQYVNPFDEYRNPFDVIRAVEEK